MLPACSLTVVSVVILILQAVIAFEISFPNNKPDGYWVANATNTLNWKANKNDAENFSVQLLATNQSQLVGNFQVANALITTNGTAQVVLDAVPEGTYSLLFVNSSNYQLEHPQVFYTSPDFQVRPNGTSLPDVHPNASAEPDSSVTASTSSDTGNAAAHSSSSTQSAGATDDAKDAALPNVVSSSAWLAACMLVFGTLFVIPLVF